MEKTNFKPFKNEEKQLTEQEKKDKIFVDGMLKRMNQKKYI